MVSKSPSRSHGEGSIYRSDYTRSSSGVTVERWVASLDLGVGPNGKRLACSSDDDPERLILPQTVPGPSVSFPVEGEPAGQLELNELLVGATVDDATEKFEAAGWAGRLYDLDDPNAGVTDDLRNDRATVEFSGGRVVRIEIG